MRGTWLVWAMLSFGALGCAADPKTLGGADVDADADADADSDADADADADSDLSLIHI